MQKRMPNASSATFILRAYKIRRRSFWSALGNFRLPTARLRSCSGASADPQKADHIRAPALVVSRVPEPDC